MQNSTPYSKFDNPSTPVRQLDSNDVTIQMGGHPQQQIHVHGMPAQEMNVYVTPVKWGWGTMVLSVFSICCCQIFGIIAFIAALTSYVDHKVKDYAGAERKRGMARGFGIAGITIGCITIVIVIIYICVAAAAITSQMPLKKGQSSIYP